MPQANKPIVEISNALIRNNRLCGSVDYHPMLGENLDGKWLTSSDIIKKTDREVETSNSIYKVLSWGLQANEI